MATNLKSPLFKKGSPLVSSSLRGDGAVPSWLIVKGTDWADSCVMGELAISGHASGGGRFSVHNSIMFMNFSAFLPLKFHF
ncbi:hypothetical protein V6N11_072134 [Hibiscus sabdariffa]|uniref:Uncharacterized protein n=1 Tax=Hibiscus sabdariffa TaxID=183260 RepID=A0ABR2U2R9_9ROSI